MADKNRNELYVRKGAPKNAERALPPMAGGDIVIEQTFRDIISQTTVVEPTADIFGGVVLTGFLDVEKVIRHVPTDRQYFLEKKYPFQLALIGFNAATVV